MDAAAELLPARPPANARRPLPACPSSIKRPAGIITPLSTPPAEPHTHPPLYARTPPPHCTHAGRSIKVQQRHLHYLPTPAHPHHHQPHLQHPYNASSSGGSAAGPHLHHGYPHHHQSGGFGGGGGGGAGADGSGQYGGGQYGLGEPGWARRSSHEALGPDGRPAKRPAGDGSVRPGLSLDKLPPARGEPPALPPVPRVSCLALSSALHCVPGGGRALRCLRACGEGRGGGRRGHQLSLLPRSCCAKQ